MRSINARFNEHIKSKHLNPNVYSIIQFDEINHKDIKSIDDYYKEYIFVLII